MANHIHWESPPLDAFDQKLIEAYRAIGRPLDELPYTPEFEKLFSLIAAEDSDVERHTLYTRLLTLRKRGQLPRLAITSSSG